jgi:hypothetical protein
VPNRNDSWDEAKRRCRLSDEDVRMAKQLGFGPKSLIKNIPSPSQKWKVPVRDWVRSLYEKKFGAAPPPAAAPVTEPPKPAPAVEIRNEEYPWPDRPEIPELVIEDPFAFEQDDEVDEDEGGAAWDDFLFRERPHLPSDADIEGQNTILLRKQCLFRWAAQLIAIEMSTLPEVRKVAAFGAVSQPLEMEVPRFRDFRRYRIEVLHECADLDLAVWMSDLSQLRQLKNAMSRALSVIQNTPYGGVAHHQVDVHIFDEGTGAYRGRLCYFGQCPKPRKRECLVPGCGAQPFLQQFEKYRFNPGRFDFEPKSVLFDRTAGFLVKPPRIDAKPARIVPPRGDDDDVPF